MSGLVTVTLSRSLSLPRPYLPGSHSKSCEPSTSTRRGSCDMHTRGPNPSFIVSLSLSLPNLDLYIHTHSQLASFNACTPHPRPSILTYIIPNTSDLVIMKLKKYFIFLTVSFLGVCEGLRSTPADNHKGLSDKLNSNVHENEEWAKEEETGTEFLPTGSTLPDCSHACGPCFPCKRVMVSYQCAVAESCPVVYRCMCKGRYYHVPFN